MSCYRRHNRRQGNHSLAIARSFVGDTPTPLQLRSGAVIGRGSVALRFVSAGSSAGPCSLAPAPTGPVPPLASVALPLGADRYYRPSALPVYTSATFSLPSPSTAAPSLRTPSRLKPVGESGSPYRGFLFCRLRPTQGHDPAPGCAYYYRGENWPWEVLQNP